MSNAAKATQRISANLSSNIIVDQMECRSGNVLEKLRNHFKTKMVLS